MFDFLSLATVTIWYVFEWFIRIAALFVVPRNRKPTSGMAWLMIIFLAPIPAALFFLAIGSPKLPKNRRSAQKVLDHYIAADLEDIKQNTVAKTVIDVPAPGKYQSLARLSRALTHLPVVAGNTVVPLADYNDTIDRIIRDVRKARSYVYIEYYILALDDTTEPLFDAIADAAAHGVVVRVLYDAYGSRKYPRFQEMKQRLRDDDVHAQSMLPLKWPGRNYVRPDLRNHRKLVVVDGQVGYTGSLNMITRDYHRRDDIVYDELVVRLTGPVVYELEAVFFTDWFSETGVLLNDSQLDLKQVHVDKTHDVHAQLLPSGPGYDDENNLKVFNSALYAAEHTVTIVNPYFVPNESLIMALVSAAKRGVQVRMINSEAIDQHLVAHAQRSYYEEMLRAGVDIYLYKEPTLLHSKYMLIDDDLSLVGSSNMDIRSFELNHELTLLTYDAAVAKKLAAITDDYLKRSTRLSKRAWLARPRHKQLFDNLARLTSSLQ